MTLESDASRIEALIKSEQLSKALWVLRDAFARNPRNQRLLTLAGKLAAAAESKATSLGSNRATEFSREAGEMVSIAYRAKEYLEQ
jgi:hypothetical protein